jgi:N-acyl-L-homoserine lactone synthetase
LQKALVIQNSLELFKAVCQESKRNDIKKMVFCFKKMLITAFRRIGVIFEELIGEIEYHPVLPDEGN